MFVLLGYVHCNEYTVSHTIWQDDSGKEHTAESDNEKATALQEFFASVYTVETDHEFCVPPPSGMGAGTGGAGWASAHPGKKSGCAWPTLEILALV